MRISAAASIFLLISGIAMTPALAQAPAEDASDGMEIEVNAPTPEQFAALEEQARALANGDEATYYATLREGLGRLLFQDVDDASRGGAAGASESLATLVAQTAESGLDDDTALRDQLDTLLEDGKDGVIRYRIVNGVVVRVGQFTETVALIDIHDNTCSGTVVGSDAVLTAAHCVCGLGLTTVQNRRAHVYFANPFVRNNNSSGQRRRIDVTRTSLFDPGYCARLAADDMCSPDLAVIRFEGSLPSYVRIAEVGDHAGDLFYDRSYVLLAGYGDTIATARPPGRVSNWPVSPPSKNAAIVSSKVPCTARLNTCTPGTAQHGCLPGSDFVIVADPIDTCTGDSGGPVFMAHPVGEVYADYSRDVQTLVGVTSRAIDANGACGPGGIYTSLFSAEARAFLRRVLGR